MKWGVTLIAACFLVSCAGVGAKREITPGNIFVSKIPNIKVKIDDSLIYKGAFKTKRTLSSDTRVPAFVENEYHIWFDSETETAVIILYMKLLKSRFSWNEAMFNRNDKNAFRISKEGNWQTYVGLSRSCIKEDAKPNEIGLDLSKLKISKMWARNASSQNKVFVIYLEKFTDKDCDTINKFENRANEKVEILS